MAIPYAMNLMPKSSMSFDHQFAGGSPTLYSYTAGKKYSVAVPDSLGPRWENNHLNPPLSARDAIALAIEKRESLVDARPNFEWELQSAALCPADVANGQWYWLVVFQEQFQGFSSGYPAHLRLVVLMDGTVVEPEIEPDS